MVMDGCWQKMLVHEWNRATGIGQAFEAGICGGYKIVDRDGYKGLLITKAPCREDVLEA